MGGGFSRPPPMQEAPASQNNKELNATSTGEDDTNTRSDPTCTISNSRIQMEREVVALQEKLEQTKATLAGLRDQEQGGASGQARISGTSICNIAKSASGTPRRLNVAWVSRPGTYKHKPDWKNQDSFLVHKSLDGNELNHIFGVYDGHGSHGRDCSTYVSRWLPEYLSESLRSGAQPKRAIRAAYFKLNSQMHVSTALNDTSSGTTAITVLLLQDTLIVANAGDSRAVMATYSDGVLQARDLSRDQNTWNKAERERVTAMGATVLTTPQLQGSQSLSDKPWENCEDKASLEDEDPPRLWLPGQYVPGCIFTRSLGDRIAEGIGVVADPEVLEWKLTPNDSMVIVASDGVWEFLSSQMVVDIVKEHQHPHQAADAVVAAAVEQWRLKDSRCDDITCICVCIDALACDGQPPSPWSSPWSSPVTTPTHARQEGSNNIVAGGFVPTLQLKRTRSSERDQGLKELLDQDLVPYSLVTHCAAEEASAVSQAKLSPPKTPNTPSEHRVICAALRANFLFEKLSNEQLYAVATEMSHVDMRKGDIVYSQGDPANQFYVVQSGEYRATVVSGDENDADVHVYKPLPDAPNPSFGDLGLMHAITREHTVICEKPGILWALHRHVWAPLAFQMRRPKESLSAANEKRLCPRVGSNVFSSKHTVDGFPVDKESMDADVTEAQKVACYNAISVNFLLAPLPDIQRRRLVSSMEKIEIRAGDKVTEQRRIGTRFYVLMAGTLEVIVDENDDAPPRRVSVYDGDSDLKPSFGELCLMYSTPRASTIVACSACVLMSLHRDVLEGVLARQRWRKAAITVMAANRFKRCGLMRADQRRSSEDALEAEAAGARSPSSPCHSPASTESFSPSAARGHTRLRKAGNVVLAANRFRLEGKARAERRQSIDLVDMKEAAQAHGAEVNSEAVSRRRASVDVVVPHAVEEELDAVPVAGGGFCSSWCAPRR